MTDAWKLRVAAAMSAQKPALTPAGLATKLGVAKSLIYKMLTPIADGGQQVSALVPRVSEILAVPMPGEMERGYDARRRRLDEILSQLTDRQLDGVLIFLESIVDRPPH